MQQHTTRVNPSEETIKIGPLAGCGKTDNAI